MSMRAALETRCWEAGLSAPCSKSAGFEAHQALAYSHPVCRFHRISKPLRHSFSSSSFNQLHRFEGCMTELSKALNPAAEFNKRRIQSGCRP